MSKEYIIALKESLEKKLKVLDETYRICQMQFDIISGNDPDYDEFDRLFDDKEICIEKISKLDEGFEIVYERVSEELKANSGEYSEAIAQMKGLITQITEVSTSISALEERIKNGVSDALIKERKGIADTKRSVNVAMNYYKNMTGTGIPDSMYMDKKK